MGIKNDYRVSTIIILCKDCNQDVGLYPARHQCNPVTKLPTLYSSTSDSSWVQSPTTPIATPERSPSPINEHKSQGRKLWGKVKENEKYKELLQSQQQQEKQSSKLWKKLINVTMPNNSLYDDCPESDDDNWEGETHVSRILREHYENQRLPLPDWLLNDTSISRKPSRRLWQVDENHTTKREKEILEIRKNTITTHTALKNSTSNYVLPSTNDSRLNNSASSYTLSSTDDSRLKNSASSYTLSPTNDNILKNSASSYTNDSTLKNSASNYALPSVQEATLKNSQSMPDVNTGRSKSVRKPSNFANVTLSMNNSIRQLYPKRSSAKLQNSTTKSFF